MPPNRISTSLIWYSSMSLTTAVPCISCKQFINKLINHLVIVYWVANCNSTPLQSCIVHYIQLHCLIHKKMSYNIRTEYICVPLLHRQCYISVPLLHRQCPSIMITFVAFKRASCVLLHSHYSIMHFIIRSESDCPFLFNKR